MYDNVTDRIKVSYAATGFFENREVIEKIEKDILLPSISIEEEQNLIQKTNQLCKNNHDIFEQFYDEHNEIYNELSNQLMLMKKTNYLFKPVKI